MNADILDIVIIVKQSNIKNEKKGVTHNGLLSIKGRLFNFPDAS